MNTARKAGQFCVKSCIHKSIDVHGCKLDACMTVRCVNVTVLMYRLYRPRPFIPLTLFDKAVLNMLNEDETSLNFDSDIGWHDR